MALAQTLAERVLVHLRSHPVEPDAADVPAEVTQDGIALAIAAQVAHVSRALKTLEVRGLVTAHLAHPRGAKRRSRAYALSHEGRSKASYLDAPPTPVTPAANVAPRAAAMQVPAARAAEAAQLLAALDEASKGAVRIALVEADAGMGKTRLLKAFGDEAAHRRARVLVGASAPTGAEQLVGPIGPALGALGFERRFRARSAGTPRERALAASLEALEGAARAETIVILLDDIHLAGPSVVEFLHGLLLALPQEARVLVVATFRQLEAWQLPNGPLYTALMPLRSLEGARHLTLGPLDESGIGALLTDAGATHVPAELLARVTRESGGNPLFALAMAEAMLDGVDEEDFFPASVRALATHRFAGLGQTEHAALQAAAVCGAEFDYETLARVHDGPEPALLAALDVLLDKLLLEEAIATGDMLRLRFAHPKIREALLGELSTPRRRWLDGRLAAQRT